MKEHDHSEQAIRSLNESIARGILLCTIVDVEVGTEFDDLTIRCKALGGGGEGVADLMFNGIDVQILRVALAGLSPATDVDRGASGERLGPVAVTACVPSSTN